MQNVSCAHLNLSLLWLPLFITCLAACEQQSIGRDRVTLLSIANVGLRIRFVATTQWCRHLGRSIGDGCVNTTLPQSASSFSCRNGPFFWLGGVCDMVGRSTPACLHWRSGHQVRKRRSSRHRRKKQQSTSSVYCNPSGLSVTRRRELDDKEGHLIYNNGDVLHSRCTQAFVYLLIRRWRF